MPGCPIRKSRDQIVFANPPRLSQLITSFIASKSQGILHTPLITFFFAPQCELTPQGRAVCSFCSAYQELVFLDGLTIHHFTIVSPTLASKRSICCHTFDFTIKSGSRVFINMSMNVACFKIPKQTFKYFLPPGIFVPDCSRHPVKPVEWANQPVRSASEPMRYRASSSVCHFPYKNLAGF